MPATIFWSYFWTVRGRKKRSFRKGIWRSNCAPCIESVYKVRLKVGLTFKKNVDNNFESQFPIASFCITRTGTRKSGEKKVKNTLNNSVGERYNFGHIFILLNAPNEKIFF